MICHRSISGRALHGGIPMYGLPFLSIHANCPSVAERTRALRRLGRFLSPLASAPWHLAQLSAKSLRPAAIWPAFPATGFLLTRSSSGTRRSHLPSASAMATQQAAVRTRKQTIGQKLLFLFTCCSQFDFRPQPSRTSFIFTRRRPSQPRSRVWSAILALFESTLPASSTRLEGL